MPVPRNLYEEIPPSFLLVSKPEVKEKQDDEEAAKAAKMAEY
jgi:hypothetical protein